MKILCAPSGYDFIPNQVGLEIVLYGQSDLPTRGSVGGALLREGYAQVWCTTGSGGLVLGSLHGLAISEADALDELTQAF